MNGSIFQNFPQFEPKLAQIYENFVKIRWFCWKFGPKLDWYMNGSHFLEKMVFVFVWVYFQIPLWHIPIKTKLEYPPALHICWILPMVVRDPWIWVQIWFQFLLLSVYLSQIPSFSWQHSSHKFLYVLPVKKKKLLTMKIYSNSNFVVMQLLFELVQE